LRLPECAPPSAPAAASQAVASPAAVANLDIQQLAPVRPALSA
jgi:hypothetical protein